MHSAKGKEADAVILVGLEANDFPATIADDPVVNLVLADADAFAFAEERRLCYVALTRTKNQVYCIVPPTHPSPFIAELRTDRSAPYVTSIGQAPVSLPCPVCGQSTIPATQTRTGKTRWRCVAVPRCPGQLQTCPACCAGAMQPTTTTNARQAQCTACGATADRCPRCPDGVLVEQQSRDGRRFLGCSAYRGQKGCRYTTSLPNQRRRAVGQPRGHRPTA